MGTGGSLSAARLLAGATLCAAVLVFMAACPAASLLGPNTPGTPTGPLPQAAEPSITPTTGTYDSDQVVTMTTATSGAAIYYTTDGTTPSSSSPVYSVPLSVSGNGTVETIRAIAEKDGMDPSAVASATLSISYQTVSTPQFTPSAGTFNSDQLVSITTGTAGATIHYETATGSGTPAAVTNSSPVYTAPIPVAGDGTTLKIAAVAMKQGMANSTVAAATFVIAYDQVSTPQYSPPPGTYTTNQGVTISTSTSGATIYYTTATGGSTPADPTVSSPVYGGAIAVNGPSTTMKIKALAVKAGMKDSTIAAATYTVLAQYSLTVNAGAGGTVSPSGASTVNHGAATSISATPNLGYSFVNWTVTSGSGVSFGNASNASTTVTLTGGAATIQANFAVIQYTLTISSSSAGTTSPAAGAYTVSYGAATSITATPSAGYGFISWTVASGTVTFGNANNASTTVTLTSGNATIAPKFGGIVTTVAGNGTAGFTGDGGAATSAELYYPTDVAVDSSGNLYIADGTNARVRKVATNGTITTVAGNGTYAASGDGGPATSAGLTPNAVAVDSSGNLYIADGNNRIRKVDTSGTITTIAGSGTAGFSGDGGPATSAKLNDPNKLAVDSSGNIYFADTGNQRVRKISATGTISTIAGNGTQGDTGDGGPATSAELSAPMGILVDSSGNVAIAETSGRVRWVNASTGTITTIIGGGAGSLVDGASAVSVSLTTAWGIARDSSGNFYVSLASSNVIIKVVSGYVYWIAGTVSYGYSGDGGAARLAAFNLPQGIAVDSSGNLYIADYNNMRIRKMQNP